MNYHLLFYVRKANFKIVSIHIISFFLLIFFSHCRSRESFEFPIYPNADNITKFSFEKGTKGISYLVKLNYPNEVDYIYNFYIEELKKKGWEPSRSEDKKWESFIDVTQIKVNYLTATWLEKDRSREIYLTLRYEIDPEEKKIPREIEQSITLQIISYTSGSKLNSSQKIQRKISNLLKEREKEYHISEIKNKISFYVGELTHIGEEKKEGYKEVEFIPFGSKNKDKGLWLIRKEAVLTEKHIENIQLKEDEFFPGYYHILFKFNNEGAKLMEKETGENIKKEFVIFVNEKPILSAVVIDKIENETKVGRWDRKEAEKLFSIITGY